MRTAKEIAEKCKPKLTSGITYIFKPEEFKQFCKQLCKEQREYCAMEANMDKGKERYLQYFDTDSIYYATEPEFE